MPVEPEPLTPSDLEGETRAQPPRREPAADPTARFAPGAVLAARYRIVAPLGKGGMGEVYRAEDIRLGQPVALKFLPIALAAQRDRLDRLVDEVRIGRQISHPNVCRLYDIVEAEGLHFVVMEYVDGEDLASLLRRIGRLPPDKALDLARGICAGLAAAHDKGVIHRDLKPANVMVDGRGHARIADFGLAIPAGKGAGGEMAGTVAYMAPEQLAGAPATTRSDVFALGLVLFETLTGRRAYDAHSIEELRARYADSAPPSVSSAVRDVDPAVERAIHRCLSRDPAQRPESARAVLAELPGGDPLQAAVLAGETPSPEMVAAAARVGDVRPAVAWSLLLGALGGLFAVTLLSDEVALHRLAPLPKPPEALMERARDVLGTLGYGERMADHASGFDQNAELLAHINADPSPRRWEKLRTSRPGPWVFYYRESPRELWSPTWIPVPPHGGPPQLGRVTRQSPPMTVPGMRTVELDAQGRLTHFVAVPPPLLHATPAPPPDWRRVLSEAGLDASVLRPTTPRWTAPVDTDARAAWEGENPDEPGSRIHVEAASHGGRPVFFRVYGPWARAAPAAPAAMAARRAFGVFWLALFVATYGAIAVLVRRNLRLGRGDRRGAARVGMAALVTLILAQLVRADHTGNAVAEFALLLQIACQGCYGLVLMWLLYLALEPGVRRRQPHALISWSRVLAGRMNDPLVARDVLIGVTAGLVLIILGQMVRVGPWWLGQPPQMPTAGVVTTLAASRHVAFFLFVSPSIALAYSLSGLFFLYVVWSMTRRRWAAELFLLALVGVISMGTGRAGPVVEGILAVAFGVVWVGVLSRVGLLATAVMLFTLTLLPSIPLTADGSAWYAGRAAAVLLLFVAATGWAFHTSLGGKPVFGRALLED